MEKTKYNVNGGIFYKIISSVAILGVFTAVGLLVFSIAGYIQMSTDLIGILISIALFCVGAILALSWIRRLESGVVKKLSIIFIIIITICTALWIAIVWIVVAMLKNIESVTDEQGGTLVLLLKITVLITMQLLASSFVAGMISRFRANYIPLQVIGIASYLFFDFYISFALYCVEITVNPSLSFVQMFSVKSDISILGCKTMIVLLILSILFIIITRKIVRALYNREARFITRMVEDYDKKLE